MKDAKGHGSASRGGQKAVANWRASHPAHQTGVYTKVPNLVKAFALNESGEGKVPEVMKDVVAKAHDPDSLGRLGVDVSKTIAEHKVDPSTLVHLAHFLATLSAFAVLDVLIQLTGWAT